MNRKREKTYEQGHTFIITKVKNYNRTKQFQVLFLLQCIQASRSTMKKYVQNNGLCSFEAKKKLNVIQNIARIANAVQVTI